MTNYTPAQLEAWAKLGPLTIHHGANSHCFEGRVLVNDDDSRCIAFVEGYEVSDADGFAVGIEPTEEAKALAAAPDLARLVLEKEKEIARKDAALNEMIATAEKMLNAIDDYNEGHGAWLAGPAIFNLARAAHNARKAMKETIDGLF